MATVANLVVSVTAKSSGLNSELGNASASIKKFATSAAKTLAIVGTAVTAGVVAGVMGIKNAVNETEAEISRLVDVAGRLNVAVADLQALQYAAEQSGLSTEGLNGALAFMLKNLGAAARGSSETARAFEDLGLSIDQLKSMDATTQFTTISKALAGITDKSQQMAIGQKIFGRGVSEALTLINEDVGGLIKEYQSLGVALTDTQAKGVEAFGDIKNKFDQFSVGFKQQVTANIAPALTEVIEYIINLVKEAGGIQEVAKKASIGLLQFGISGITAVSGLISWFKEFGVMIDKIKLAIETVAATFARFVDATKAVSLSKWKEGFGLGEAAFNFANPDQATQDRMGETLGKSVDNLITGTEKLNTYQESANKTVNDLKAILEKQVQAVQQMTTNVEAVKSGVDGGVVAGRTGEVTTGRSKYDDRPNIITTEVKLRVNDNLFDVIDQRIDTKMSNGLRSTN